MAFAGILKDEDVAAAIADCAGKTLELHTHDVKSSDNSMQTNK